MKNKALMVTGVIGGFVALLYAVRYAKVHSSANKVLEKLKPSLVGTDFAQKVDEIAKALGVPASWLLMAMYLESGINAKSPRNYSGSGAVGLIGFMPQTANWLGTSAGALYGMGLMSQLDYVRLYFEKQFSIYPKPSNFMDFYALVFYPKIVGKPNSYIVGSEVSAAYASRVASQNSPIDLDRNGQLTAGEFRKNITERVNKTGGSSLVFYNPLK